MDIDLIGFLAVVGLAYLIPGPDLIVISRFAAHSRRQGRAAALGAQTGLCIHMLAASLGLSAVAANSAVAFTLIKWLGALYLMVLGCQTVLAGRHKARSGRSCDPAPECGVEHNQPSRAFYTALVTNVMNPKATHYSPMPFYVPPCLPCLSVSENRERGFSTPISLPLGWAWQ